MKYLIQEKDEKFRVVKDFGNNLKQTWFGKDFQSEFCSVETAKYALKAETEEGKRAAIKHQEEQAKWKTVEVIDPQDI